MYRAAVVLCVSAALVACSADTFVTPDDGGVDAPVVVGDAGSDASEAGDARVADASDATLDAPAKTWCQSLASPPALCADFDEGDLVSGFAGGQPVTFPPVDQPQGTAKLVAGKSSVGGMQFEGSAPQVQPVDVGLSLPLGTTSKQIFVFSFALKVDAIDTSSAVPQFLANIRIAQSCAMALQIVPATRELILVPAFAGPAAPSGMTVPSSAWSRITLTTTATAATLSASINIDGVGTYQAPAWAGASCPATSAPTFNLALHADPVVTTTRLVFDEVLVRVP